MPRFGEVEGGSFFQLLRHSGPHVHQPGAGRRQASASICRDVEVPSLPAAAFLATLFGPAGQPALLFEALEGEVRGGLRYFSSRPFLDLGDDRDAVCFRAETQCGDAAPGGDTLPFAGFDDPADVVALLTEIMEMDPSCAALPTINNAVSDADKLCAATGILPPGKDGSLGGTNNADAQLLAFLLNIKAGKLPTDTLVDKTCLGFANGVMSVGEIATAACLDPEAFQALLDAINNLDPVGGETMCLSEATCPDDAKITDSMCPALP